MNIKLPSQDINTNRRFYSLDGTPIIIDFTQTPEEIPVAAFRLGTQDRGFIWLPLEQDLFLGTFADGKEVNKGEFFGEVLPAFTESRAPGGSSELDFAR
ncbi:MAG: hypothetical protein KDI65_02715 [Alphaproteobacteria bacterium]|nr:hypothetical protein [Alphaproteobacteria bacterium]